MLKVGITGGIGSGKTTVAGIFQSLGIPVYDADSAAKRIMNNDPKVKEAIVALFGPKSYNNGILNKTYISAAVHADPSKLEQLNAIVHPATKADADDWMEAQDAPYALKEAAILFEAGADKFLDYVIGVSAPKDIRINRVEDRDGKSEEEILSWMEKQMDEAEKMALCDFIIQNDGEQFLIPQVLEVHRKLLRLAHFA